ncbi:class II fructose-bisphosphate aldolase [Nannocystis sp. RBIL2]|uniref:class II fructose-bisphosphate aldolase n=1 Tax=Nannocystis sp. RBIL2 TaxID=2996788 RepID=UPI00226FC2BA|nr:class II fructose-bisphosphate aldolase [Nannocystis sp. RBIL2]MCY1067400.1 class II fructose-bisphosphate aldolase [Nannocystis sp. RBIL2]
MPVADYATYCRMLDNARANKFAYPAINITSSSTINAALAAFSEAKSDGILQVSTGGGEFASGQGVKDMAFGAIALAEFIHRVAERHPHYVAIHTDHCPADKIDKFMRPLLAETRRRRAAGLPNLFSSHMFDGSELPLGENMKVARELLQECAELEIILEVEAGVVGGEEDGVNNEHAPASKLYTTPEDMVAVARALREIKGGRYMFAATFGNVHGVYKPGNVKLKPTILRDGQQAVAREFGEAARFDLVFHGGSGSELSEIHETLEYGVVKMNIDTDTQYTYTRPIADHMLKNYDGVLKIDGEVGNKKQYDPRSYLKAAEKSMQARIKQACADLRSTGTTLFKR